MLVGEVILSEFLARLQRKLLSVYKLIWSSKWYFRAPLMSKLVLIGTILSKHFDELSNWGQY